MKRRFSCLITFFVVGMVSCASVQAFWPKNMCQRVMAAVYAVPQKVKSFKTNWFTGVAEESTFGPKKNSSFFSRSLSYLAMPILPAYAYDRKKTFADKTKLKIENTQNNAPAFNGNRDRVITLACNVLYDLGIKPKNALEQIKLLDAQQQFKALEVIMRRYQSADDETMLPEIWQVMQHLKEPAKKYEKFFRIISNNLGNCSRSSLTTDLKVPFMKCRTYGGGDLPELLAAKIKEIPYSDLIDYYGYKKPFPEWLEVMRGKMPCDAPSAQSSKKAA